MSDLITEVAAPNPGGKNMVVFAGDIHEEFGRFRYRIRNSYSNAYVVQVGDFGIGFYRPGYYQRELFHLNRDLQKVNCHLLVIRGNHDNPGYFQDEYMIKNFSNITFLKDYSEMELLGRRILFVGGATSIDRLDREPGRSWWSSEVFHLPAEFPNCVGRYDVVTSHTRPGFITAHFGNAHIAYYLDRDVDLAQDLSFEGLQMGRLYEMTRPKAWFYGHFHRSSYIRYEDTVFRCVDIHEHIQGW